MKSKPHIKNFNNPDVVTKGWYIAASSHDLASKQTKSIDLCGQKIVLFRGEDSKVRALDAYCPHMGTNLSIGKVDGNYIRCFFHHWAFDGTGDCRDIPCQSHIPSAAKTRSYAVDEKYGFIWIYPDSKVPAGVAEFDELKDQKTLAIPDRILERNCHHHICMMNGIDAQHLQTVHQLNIEMQLDLTPHQSGTVLDFTLSGKFPKTNFREKIAAAILGDSYTYTMRYAHGCIGLLTIMKNVKRIPPLHMIYAYVPLENGRTRIQPIYVAAQRSGILGRFKTRFLLWMTRMAYYFLRDEDGLIYDNIQFQPKALLPIDKPIVEYMNYVNKLEVSDWSNFKNIAASKY